MRSIRAAIFILIFSTLPMLVHADCFDFQDDIIGKQYEITLNNCDFVLSFDIDSITRCPSGKAIFVYTLEQDGWTRDFELDFDYSTNDQDGFITIDGFGYIFFGNNKLYVFPLDTPLIEMVKSDTKIPFPW